MCATWWGDYEVGRESTENAIAVYTRLVDRFPDKYGLELAACYHQLASLFEEIGQPDQAVDSYRRCLQFSSKTAKKRPINPAIPGDLEGLRLRCEPVRAYVLQQTLDRTIAKWSKAIRQDPQDPRNARWTVPE